jgi:hypothetical protein
MGQKALKYFAVLIGTYLVVVHYTGTGKDLSAATGFVVGTTKALQGR